MRVYMNKILGQRFKNKRLSEKLSQKALSERINIPARTISSIERGTELVDEKYIIIAYEYIGASYSQPIFFHKIKAFKNWAVKSWKKLINKNE